MLNPYILCIGFVFTVCYFFFSEGVIAGSPPEPQPSLSPQLVEPMDSGTKGTTLLSLDCPQESVRLVRPLQELVEYMNSNLDLDFAKWSIYPGKIWIMITITTTIC